MPIIPLSDSGLETESWQKQLRDAVTDISVLSELLNIEPPCVNTDFPLLVPRPYLERMEKGCIDDPLLLQVLPRPEENSVVTGYTADPLDERSFAESGLIKKYDGRALVVTTPACAVNCRYCFRRHFPYEDHRPGQAQWRATITKIEQDPSISEVILSGGDPLIVTDNQIAALLDRLSSIDHITTIRFHTRLPVVIPSRVTGQLLSIFAGQDKPVVVVLHINHPNEIDDSLTDACKRLRSAGVTLLNQSVLLRGINDDAISLEELSRKLFNAGVLPYYLHLLDPVAGASHFETSEDKAMTLVRMIRNRLPGYLVPRLVREVPHEGAKQPIYS